MSPTARYAIVDRETDRIIEFWMNRERVFERCRDLNERECQADLK